MRFLRVNFTRESLDYLVQALNDAHLPDPGGMYEMVYSWREVGNGEAIIDAQPGKSLTGKELPEPVAISMLGVA